MYLFGKGTENTNNHKRNPRKLSTIQQIKHHLSSGRRSNEPKRYVQRHSIAPLYVPFMQYCNMRPIPKGILGKGKPYFTARTSISTSAPLGRSFTATAERAGKGWEKNWEYTSFMATKLAISLRKTVVFTT